MAHDLVLAIEINGNDFAGAPLSKPEAALMPSRRLDHGKSVQEDRCIKTWRGWHRNFLLLAQGSTPG
jgi:hypothetical protein